MSTHIASHWEVLHACAFLWRSDTDGKSIPLRISKRLDPILSISNKGTANLSNLIQISSFNETSTSIISPTEHDNRDIKIGVSSQPQTWRCHVTSHLPSGLPSAVHVSTPRPASRGKSFTAEFFCYLTIAKPRLKPTKCSFLVLRTIISDVWSSIANFPGEFWHLIQEVRVE